MYYECDFETTNNETDCRVWLAGKYNIDTEDFEYFYSIDDFFNNLIEHNSNDDRYYFHNLTFDGDFIINYLFKSGYGYTMDKAVNLNEFNVLMSNAGVIYCIKVCYAVKKRKKFFLIFYNSYTVIPFKVSDLPQKFGLTEQKGSINYNKKRDKGYIATAREIDYLKRDCVIAGKSLKIALAQGITKMTIGSASMQVYTDMVGGRKKLRHIYPEPRYDADIRPAYKGGYNYLNPSIQGRIIGKGMTLDVNALYAYVLETYPMPYGNPLYKSGAPKPLDDYPLFITSFYCSFALKKEHLPFVQIKHDLMYKSNEYLTDSKGIVNLYMTSVELDLFFAHYDVDDITWCGCYYFKCSTDNFKHYVEYYAYKKEQADLQGNQGVRTLSKLMLCNLGGRFAINPYVISRHPAYINGKVEYLRTGGEWRTPMYVPVSIFMTAQARVIVIAAGQNNYDRYLYSDTDSLHLSGWELPTNIEIDPRKTGAWKIERKFDKAKFVKQKCYIEKNHDTGNIDVVCSGLPDICHSQVTFDNFNPGAVYYGNLRSKRVAGGTVLVNDVFKIK